MKLGEYLYKLRDKRAAVIGAGISNTPLIELLLKNGIAVTVHDKRTRSEFRGEAERFEEIGARLMLGGGYLDDLDSDIIFRTPSLMPDNPAIKRAVLSGAELTSEMEVFFEVCPCRIIAITGSDGKTTTTSIIAELLKREGYSVHVGGNIGNPLLSNADKMKEDDIAVIELSSFQLITMKKSPNIAVVTNVAPNHLDIHDNMDEYVNAKRNIFLYQGESDKAVFNLDNSLTREFSESAPGKTIYFSRRERVENGVFLDGNTIYEAADGHKEAVMSAGEILLPGVHNIENYMAAFAAVYGLVSRDTMRETARAFPGVAHRIEFICEKRGVKYYNDSIASSPTRTMAGLRAFDRKVILIAGGKDKGLTFDELGAEIIKRVKTLVLTGLTAEKIKTAVTDSPEYSGTPEIAICDDFKDAVLAASEFAKDGDIVLLSPACTSFDRFKNFEERGNTFREIVRGL